MNAAETTATRQLVVFRLGVEQYALPIESVQEVIRFQSPRAVSSSDPSLLGVINLRGRIVPVHDVRDQLNITHDPLPQELDEADVEATKIVLVSVDQRVAGVVVDDVSEVLSAPSGEFEDLPAADSPIVDGVVKADQRLIVLLDPDALAGLADGERS